MSSPAYEGGSGGYIKRRLFKNSARTASRLLSSVLPKRLSVQSGAEEKHLVIALLSYLHHPKLRRDGKCYETYLWILPKAYNSLLGSHGLTIIEIVGVATLVVDMRHFDITSQVPTGLSQYVSSSNSKEEQASWHNKLLKAWNEDWPPPKQPEVATMLVIQTLYMIMKTNFEGFLTVYGLPYVSQTIEEDIEVTTTRPEGITPPLPEGVQFELLILPNNRRVDAPEVGMTYGEEAKQVLVKMIQGKCLKIHVYDEDIDGRSVGDVYCNDIFIQKQLLKRGCV